MNDLSVNQRSGNSSNKLPRSNSSSHLYSPGRLDVIDNRPYKNRTRNLNWLFLKACIGNDLCLYLFYFLLLEGYNLTASWNFDY